MRAARSPDCLRLARLARIGVLGHAHDHHRMLPQGDLDLLHHCGMVAGHAFAHSRVDLGFVEYASWHGPLLRLGYRRGAAGTKPRPAQLQPFA